MEYLLHHYFPNPENYKPIPVGDGHINDTYRLLNPNGKDYLLQRINHQVFPDVPSLMKNLVMITDFIKKQPHTYSSKVDHLTVLPTTDGRFYHQTKLGEYWRILNFFEHHTSHTIPDTNPAIAHQQIHTAARAFGHFLYQLRDFPVHQLSIVLPDFHNVPVRLSQLKKAVSANPKNRLSEIANELAIIEKLKPQMCVIQQLANQQKIPLRVTHNDTKFNNVLFGKNGAAPVVIDLDTVMPGYVHYDYGDGLRTATVTTAEDEKNLDHIQVDWERYKAFQKGYLSATSDLLQPLEKSTLALAAPTLAYLMAVRFFTDYLLGDLYYKTGYPQQNLYRGRAQLRLTEQFLLI